MPSLEELVAPGKAAILTMELQRGVIVELCRLGVQAGEDAGGATSSWGGDVGSSPQGENKVIAADGAQMVGKS